jgi:hypothetical protein
MEVCSSTEMGALGASRLGTGDHGPKTDRSRPRVAGLHTFFLEARLPAIAARDFGGDPP